MLPQSQVKKFKSRLRDAGKYPVLAKLFKPINLSGVCPCYYIIWHTAYQSLLRKGNEKALLHTESADGIDTSFLESNLIKSIIAIKMVIAFDPVNLLLVIYSQETIQIKAKVYTQNCLL